MAIGRNALCPCGSGLKFKRCCAIAGGATGASSAIPADPKRFLLPLSLFGAAIGIGVLVGTLRSAIADGVAVSLALILGVIIYLMARNPPEGTGKGGNTAINFGLDGKGRRRGRGPANRSQRRRR
jgi:hypothetical protein